MPNTTPDTAAYLYLGLAAIVVLLGIFIGSMIVRYSNYRKDLERIQRADQR